MEENGIYLNWRTRCNQLFLREHVSQSNMCRDSLQCLWISKNKSPNEKTLVNARIFLKTLLYVGFRKKCLHKNGWWLRAVVSSVTLSYSIWVFQWHDVVVIWWFSLQSFLSTVVVFFPHIVSTFLGCRIVLLKELQGIVFRSQVSLQYLMSWLYIYIVVSLPLNARLEQIHFNLPFVTSVHLFPPSLNILHVFVTTIMSSPF